MGDINFNRREKNPSVGKGRETSKYGKFISFYKRTKLFVIRINKKEIATFKTHDEAIAARDEALKIMGIEL